MCLPVRRRRKGKETLDMGASVDCSAKAKTLLALITSNTCVCQERQKLLHDYVECHLLIWHCELHLSLLLN